MYKLPKFEKKIFFATAHARGGLKSSLGTCYKNSAGAIKFSTQKLAKNSWETKVDIIFQMDLPVWRTINFPTQSTKPLTKSKWIF